VVVVVVGDDILLHVDLTCFSAARHRYLES